jgi:CheY-like chemotaxis protein/HPt (histidine-containing phosphotransfer) domain-containing protein
MVVDDNEMNLQVVLGLLKRSKINIVTAMSGRECLDKLDDSYNLILLDHMMPGMDGIETLQEIHQITVEIPVIALTANAAHDGRDYYRSKGFIDYLAKPVDGDLLEETIRKYLPDNLIHDVDPNEVEKEKPHLSESLKKLVGIEGINLDDGINFCGSTDSLEKFLDTFYGTIDDKAKEIEDAFNSEDYSFYTIKVHALKSTARIIGAKELSELALSLEEAGKSGNIDLIKEKTKTLLSLYRSYKGKLHNYFAKRHQNEGEKETITEDMLKDAYGALKELVPAMDYDAVEMVLNELDKYDLPSEEKEKINKLQDLLKKADWDEMESILK